MEWKENQLCNGTARNSTCLSHQWDYFTNAFYWVLIRNSLPKAMMVGKQNWTKIFSILSCAERTFGRERLNRICNNYSQILKFLIQIGYSGNVNGPLHTGRGKGSSTNSIPGTYTDNFCTSCLSFHRKQIFRGASNATAPAWKDFCRICCAGDGCSSYLSVTLLMRSASPSSPSLVRKGWWHLALS